MELRLQVARETVSCEMAINSLCNKTSPHLLNRTMTSGKDLHKKDFVLLQLSSMINLPKSPSDDFNVRVSAWNRNRTKFYQIVYANNGILFRAPNHRLT